MSYVVKDHKYDFSYGFYVGRRREQAILVHHAVVWRLTEAARQAKGQANNTYSHVTTMRDIANAFPSLRWTKINAAISEGGNHWTRQC